MPGNREGGKKAAARNLAKNPNFYREIGAKGGRNGHTGGFAYKDNATKFGKKGGIHSHRGYKLIERHENYGVYEDLWTGEKKEFKW